MVEHTGLNRQGRQKYAFIVVITVTLILIFITGCDRYTKQKVLTFFFTGVPPLEENNPQTSLQNTVQVAVERVEVSNTWPSVHGPYDAGECYRCHVIKGDSKELALGAFPSFQSLPKDLLIPKNEICIECHTTKSTIAAYTKNLWIHGPVSAGMCTSCHHYHYSAFPYMLLKKTSRELCSQCHIDGSITQIEEHIQDKECSFCHNPHLGKNRFLLKEDFFEIY